MVSNKGFSAWWRYMGCLLDCLGWTIKNNNLGMYICYYWQTNKRRKILIKTNRFHRIIITKHNKPQR